MGIQVPSAAPFVIPMKLRKTTGSFFLFCDITTKCLPTFTETGLG